MGSKKNRPSRAISLHGILGLCGSQQVFLGFAPASLLYSISFADVLDEETGQGYQRRFNDKHSIDFRRYIQGSDSTTIPLTFNLRPRRDRAWQLTKGKDGNATLRVQVGVTDVLSQVDCQHRLSTVLTSRVFFIQH